MPKSEAFFHSVLKDTLYPEAVQPSALQIKSPPILPGQKYRKLFDGLFVSDTRNREDRQLLRVNPSNQDVFNAK